MSDSATPPAAARIERAHVAVDRAEARLTSAETKAEGAAPTQRDRDAARSATTRPSAPTAENQARLSQQSSQAASQAATL